MYVLFRNYHVFYYLLVGSNPNERQALHLLNPEDYAYLNKVAFEKAQFVLLFVDASPPLLAMYMFFLFMRKWFISK